MPTFASIAHSRDTAYVVSADWKLLRVNDGWKRFALENGGEDVLQRWPVGASIDGVISALLVEHYRAAFARVHETRTHWEHDYECSSADVYRLMHMTVYPLEPGQVLVVSSPTIERPHTDAVVQPRLDDYERQGYLSTCSHCRRFRNVNRSGAWDWVPDFVRTPPNLSHGLCPTCVEFYYPEPQRL